MIDGYIKSFEQFGEHLFQALIETFDMMLTAMVLSLVLGVILGFFLFLTRTNGIYQNKFIYFILSGFSNITRSIPFILFIIVMIPLNRMIIGTGFGLDASK